MHSLNNSLPEIITCSKIKERQAVDFATKFAKNSAFSTACYSVEKHFFHRFFC
ncbi:hypothetical protein X874_5030 [Mannheimia varigena USDA-ARS-USMARC-1312]|uniref:Uncharacterized protein n=1 Tax=Mannheimia varigena USDA-ARS-USMARC-1296 TaxID=1433287 RepID=W0Q7Z6_9PAST|nr:hypothetical protein X808_4910 [Mannheimia varigena USDA-ARS-USMARC-1296]AHG77139.1 hypothetical protein X874_5030 [Mannheimia varigena USDA-ARS-USMARC-1312]AHG80200.1 hypothetical protein X875_15820 [Mannheimia varigena USDA-ARS-USMARC-1388]